MPQDSQADNIQKELSGIPNAKVLMSGGGYVFLQGFQEAADCNYSLSLRINDDQHLTFSEEYNYLPRKDDPNGMVYVYALAIPADQQSAFLKLLLEKCGREEGPAMTIRPELMLELLTALVEQKQLAVPRPRGERNLNLLSGWLKAANISYSGPYLIF